jgi:hypothetical protein
MTRCSHALAHVSHFLIVCLVATELIRVLWKSPFVGRRSRWTKPDEWSGLRLLFRDKYRCNILPRLIPPLKL